MQPSEQSSRLDTIASYVLIATAILAPLAFWPSQYFALEAVKTITIALGTLISAGLFLAAALKEKTLRLPPKAMLWTGSLLALATIVSSIASGHFMKSFFGQGFEIGTGSFLCLLLVAGWVAYTAVTRRVDRVMVLYSAIGGSFLVLFLLHALRFIFGPGFASLGILNQLTSTMAGTWYSLGIFSGVVAVIALTSILLLPLPSKMRNLYWGLVVIAGFGVFLIGAREIWEAIVIVLLGLALYVWKTNPTSKKKLIVPLVGAALALLMVFQGPALSTPVVDKIGAGYSELSLPWQMTLDVAAGELKAQPLFGTGPNRFSQAFLTYKPAVINTSDLWGVEFNSGFGLIPTFVVTQGFVGSLLWVVFFVLFVILGVRSLRHVSSNSVPQDGTVTAESEQPYARFAVLSSFLAASFLWIMAMLYTVPHAMVYYAFILTGIWLGASVVYGRIHPVVFSAQEGTRMSRFAPALTVVALVVAIVWGITYVKDTIALAYFDRGLKELTVTGNPTLADDYFAKAVSIHPTDIFWQGRAEATVGKARALITAAGPAAASSTEIATQASKLVNEALQYSQNAVLADSSNYYNYVSAARVAESANSLRMAQSYETGVGAYMSAIRLNPLNPSLYVSLARFQASNNKLDDSIQTVGAALQVKNNYLEAVFLLSQIEAAKGNLADAITAAAFAVKLNPQNPILHFQLGLFQYTAASYADAAVSLADAIKIQPDYANAQYFLGLAYARLGRNSDAIAQFQQLSVSNPTNTEIPLILSALRSGQSLFGGSQPALKTPPEKRSSPPLPEKSKK